MTRENPIQLLIEHLHPWVDLQRSAAVLGWDQEVNMPPKGATARAEQLATLSRLAHELFVSSRTDELLRRAESAAKGLPVESDEASQVRITRREFDRSVRIPSDFVAELSRSASAAFVAWHNAKETNHFATFAPHLERMIELNRSRAEFLGYEKEPYDALLDLYEPGMTAAYLEPLFDSLGTELKKRIPMIVNANRNVDLPPGTQFPEDAQWNITLRVLREMGYDFEAGRQDRAPHPFTTSFSTGDVRVTTRLLPDNPFPGIFATMHEGGHALYDQGIPDSLDRTVLAEGASLGVHESQSRLWENHVGRSRAFLAHLFALMTEAFASESLPSSEDEFTALCRSVAPGLIRVSADEVTYNLHIIIRTRIERDLISGKLRPTDAREVWNSLYRDYLGLEPSNDAEGILQDVHWAHGAFGYFPTYTLGNLMAAFLYDRACKELPDLEEGFRRGHCAPLLDWLRKRVHRHGARFPMTELLRREFGTELSSEPFLRHIDRRYLSPE